MRKKLFGTLPDGTPVEQYTLENDSLCVSILTLGGIVSQFITDGVDVVSGFDTVADYLADDSYQGALVGRFANRIDSGKFCLNGKTYQLAKNENGKHHLHGGTVGFNRRIWTVTAADDVSLRLSLFSPDGEENYPGNLVVSVLYRLCGDALVIDYTALSDADTAVGLTNHCYFNLSGYASCSILTHEAQIFADTVSEADDELIPTGRHIPVEGTLFDLRTPHPLGDCLRDGYEGYDINFHLSSPADVPFAGYLLRKAATVRNETRELNVYTDRENLQFYIGNMLKGAPDFKGGVKRVPHTTYCLETQAEPNALDRGEGILRAGEVYRHVCVYQVRKR